MKPKAIRPHSLRGVFTDGSNLYTRSLLGHSTEAGATVEGENGHNYRPFHPNHSKLAAMVKRQGRTWPFEEASRVLYLGAGAGTTVSFMSDICPEGLVVAVEFAPEPFRSLVEVARARSNVVPILADARRPEAYAAELSGGVDVVYQDIAQRDQWDIMRRNADAYLPPGGWAVLNVKASSEDVSKPPQAVYEAVGRAIEGSPYSVVEFVELDPFERGHGTFVLRRRG